jgi:hypothetical protein
MVIEAGYLKADVFVSDSKTEVLHRPPFFRTNLQAAPAHITAVRV